MLVSRVDKSGLKTIWEVGDRVGVTGCDGSFTHGVTYFGVPSLLVPGAEKSRLKRGLFQ